MRACSYEASRWTEANDDDSGDEDGADVDYSLSDADLKAAEATAKSHLHRIQDTQARFQNLVAHAAVLGFNSAENWHMSTPRRIVSSVGTSPAFRRSMRSSETWVANKDLS